MSKRKTAAAAALAATAAAGMVTGAVIDTPAELLADTPLAVEQQADEAEQKKAGPAARVREWLLGLPAAVRVLVCLPLWCIGEVLLTALATFFAGASTPLAAQFLNWLCLAVVLLAVFALSVKFAFPKVKFRRILRLRNILLLAILSAVLAAADLALPAVWEGYDPLSRTVWRVGAACLLAAVCCGELKRQGKRAEKQRVKAVKRTAVEQEALRLADSVCPPRE